MSEVNPILFIATTDSYLKWVNSLRTTLEGPSRSEIFMVKSLQNPSKRQIEIAVGGDASKALKTLHIFNAIRWTLKNRPSVIFVGATGPFLVLFRWLLNFSSTGREMKLISGSPGIAFHLIGSPLVARSEADLILVSSPRERDRFRLELEKMGAKCQIALHTLPFLEVKSARDSFNGAETVVFAPQPDLPKTKEEREYLLLELGKLKEVNPDLEIQVKLRAIPGEAQTHFEKFPYKLLAEELEESGRLKTGSLNFVQGGMSDYLRNKNATLITVSSTAALESLALGNKTQIITDFGVSDSLATAVFSESGLLRRISELADAECPSPSLAWMSENYFHSRELNDWQGAVKKLEKTKIRHQRHLLPNSLSKSLLFGELLRTVFPNRFGAFLIRFLKLLFGKGI